MFSTICDFIQNYLPEEIHKQVLLNKMESYLKFLSTNFSKYFFAEDDIKLYDLNWACIK